MPTRPLHPCARPRCGNLTSSRFCAACTPAEAAIAADSSRHHDHRRGSAASRGYGADWRRLRDQVLSEEPLCRECGKQGRVTAAECVDHIIPHRGDETLRLSRSNLQPLCTPCHSAKTAREDGAFGNPRRHPRSQAHQLRDGQQSPNAGARVHSQPETPRHAGSTHGQTTGDRPLERGRAKHDPQPNAHATAGAPA